MAGHFPGGGEGREGRYFPGEGRRGEIQSTAVTAQEFPVLLQRQEAPQLHSSYCELPPAAPGNNTRVNHSLQLHLSGNQSHISSPTSAK